MLVSSFFDLFGWGMGVNSTVADVRYPQDEGQLSPQPRRSLAIVQVPAVLLTLPVIAYVLATEPATPAIIFVVWTLIAGLSDNVLKSLMIGRGLEVPMPIILFGVIVGMLTDGLLGLIVGPVVLAVGYVLLMGWLRHDPVEGGPQNDGRTL